MWDIFYIVYTFIFLYLYSIFMFFAQEEEEIINIYYYFLTNLFIQLFDCLIMFNSAYFDKDLLITERQSIGLKYIKSYFVVDFIPIVLLFLKLMIHSQNMFYNKKNSLYLYIVNSIIFIKSFSVSNKRNKLESIITLKDN